MTESSQTLLEHFKAKKAEKDSVALQEARLLVNLYRSLSCFGNDFLEKYNQMLLNAKPGVRRLFSMFMGGDEVEEYLEFLLQNVHLTKEEVEKNTTQGIAQTKGYLPTPEADIPSEGQPGMITISKEEWDKLNAQKETLAKRLQVISDAAKKTESSALGADFGHYSEILEETSGGEKNE